MNGFFALTVSKEMTDSFTFCYLVMAQPVVTSGLDTLDTGTDYIYSIFCLKWNVF